MKYKFPVYVVHTDNVELIDGILWVEDQVRDDKNMSGETLGKRRSQTVSYTHLTLPTTPYV